MFVTLGSSLLTVFVFVLFVGVLGLVFMNQLKGLFKGLMNLLGARINDAAEAVANADPLGVYKLQIENAIEKGKNVTNVVNKAAKQIESLKRQVQADQKESQRLSNRIESVLSQGDPNKTAEQYALDLERIESNLVTNTEQLKNAESIYNDNLTLVEKYEREVTSARKDLERLGFQLAQTTAEKELIQMNSSLKGNLNLGDLAEARQRVLNKIDENRGTTQASRDLSKSTLAEEADEEIARKLRAKEILTRFSK